MRSEPQLFVSDDERVQSYGDAVMLDGEVIARCTDWKAAKAIAIALTFSGLAPDKWPAAERAELEEYLT